MKLLQATLGLSSREGSILPVSSPCARYFTWAAVTFFTVTVRLFADSPAIEWSVYDPGIHLGPWNARLVMSSDESGWLGGCRGDLPAKDLLYRLHDGRWLPVTDFPTVTSRSFVLDVDPAGNLWIASFLPDEDSTYGGLRIDRFDGHSWQHEIVTPGIWPQTMTMVAEDEGWIAGNHGLLLHYKDGRWRRTSLDLPAAEREALTIFDLFSESREDGWAIGNYGLVARYENGRWRRLEVPPELAAHQLNGLDFTADGSLFVVGNGGLVARFKDDRWHLQRPVDVELSAIDMITDDDGWAVGESGTVLRFDGRRWQRQPTPATQDLYDITMQSADSGWIVGPGVVLRSHRTPRVPLREVPPSPAYPMLKQASYRAAAADFNTDGHIDLLTMSTDGLRVFLGRSSSHGFRQPGDLIPLSSDREKHFYFLTLAYGDLDGDGDLDIVTAGEGSEDQHVLINRGDATFIDATDTAGIGTVTGRGNIPYLVDLDSDGQLDLYLARGYDLRPAPIPNLLYLGDGTAHFTLADQTTGARGIEKSVLWGDLDGDGDLDAVLPDYNSATTLLYLGDGHGGLIDATHSSGIDGLADGLYFQGHLADLDIDGDLDLLLLGEELYLFRNDGQAHFTLASDQFSSLRSTVGIGSRLSAVGDLDHDGYPDLIVQPVANGRSSVRLYLHDAGGYRDVTATSALTGLQGEGAVLADFDADGDLDLFVATTPRGRLFVNEIDDDRYLVIRPRGVTGSRQATAATVEIFTAGHLGDRSFLKGFQQVGVGGNSSGLTSLDELHFGLDAEQRYDVRVTFANGRRVVRPNLASGRVVTVYELPAGIRQITALALATRQRLRTMHLPLELGKLTLALLLLSFGRHWLAKWSHGERLLTRRSVTAALAAAYLVTVAVLADHDTKVASAAPVAGLAMALGALAVVDRRLTRWHRAHYLGPYRLTAPVGEGGMGIVYRARHVVTRQQVAVKVIHPRLLDDPASRRRFLRESRLMLELDHPNVLHLLASGEIDGRVFLATELLTGITLGARLEQREPLPAADLLVIAAVVCDALAFLHARAVVHGDVKSDNIFLQTSATAGDGWAQRVKLMDLGLARCSSPTASVTQAAILGTLTHMPPEQLRGETLDGRADLYALGVVLYHGLSGQLPFTCDGPDLVQRILCGETGSLRSHCPRLSPAIEEVVMTLMARAPQDRFATAEAAGQALRRVSRGDLARSDVADVGGIEVIDRERDDSPEEPAPTWRRQHARALRYWQAGQQTAAEVAALECLATLRRELDTLDTDEREIFCANHEVAAVIELIQRVQTADNRRKEHDHGT